VTEQHLADLRAARKILAIDVASTAGGRGWIHPRFQFDGSGQLFSEIALVLEAFGDADPIAVCDWFAEPNPLLDNHPPMKFWLTDRARVVQAAQRTVKVGRESFFDLSGAFPDAPLSADSRATEGKDLPRRS
jgi:hypothetical protein